MKTVITWSTLYFILCVTLAYAGIPQTINYQGYLKDGTIPANGQVNMVFSLYSSAIPRNNPVWQEPQKQVVVTNGIYSTTVGSKDHPIMAPFDVPYFLGVNINGTDLPVHPLSSVPYAARAAVAETALSVANGYQQLLVLQNGSGGGSVLSTPAGIATPMLPLAAFTQGTKVTLTATPDPNSVFYIWSGACNGSETTCTVTMNGLTTAIATFIRPNYVLNVNKYGSGTVYSTKGGIYCGVRCNDDFQAGTAVTLNAVPDQGFATAAWSGACSGEASICSTIMTSDKTIGINFGYLLSVNLTNMGGGTIVSYPSAIDCPAGKCSAVVDPGTTVTLYATPVPGGSFIGWAGDCFGTGVCNLNMSQARSVGATFSIPLTVSRYNNGGGTITSEPGGISCGGGGSCFSSFTYGTSILLTAQPGTGATFSQWNGCDNVTSNSCSVSMTGVKNVQAKFTYPLTVAKTGSGDGTITGTGISCGPTCAASYGYGDPVSLVAVSDGTSVFNYWVGCDSIAGSTCTVSANSARTVTANFTRVYPVTVSKSGTGGGNVASSPAGISCGAACSANYDAGSAVSLTASPDQYSSFTGWTGCDSPTGATCNLSMNQGKSVSAIFDYTRFTISVYPGGSNGGSGSLSLTSIPSTGVNSCSASAFCIYSYLRSSNISITAMPDSGSIFNGWTNCPSAIGPVCTLYNIQTGFNVQASFTKP